MANQTLRKVPLKRVALRAGFSAPSPRADHFKPNVITTTLLPKPPGKRSVVFVVKTPKPTSTAPKIADSTHRTPASLPIVTRTPVDAVVHLSSDRPPSPGPVVKTPPEAQPVVAPAVVQESSRFNLDELVSRLGKELEGFVNLTDTQILVQVSGQSLDSLNASLKSLATQYQALHTLALRFSQMGQKHFYPPKPTPA